LTERSSDEFWRSKLIHHPRVSRIKELTFP